MPKTLTAPASPLTADARIGRNVRAELVRHGITQGQAADELDLTRPALVKRLSGQTAFKASELQALGLMLGVDVDRFYRADLREAGAIRVATLLLACAVVSVVILGGTAAFGHLILWLAGIDSAPLLATALVGLGLTGVPVYALVVIVDDARKRRDRRARVLTAIGDLRVPAQRSARVLTHR